MYLQNKTQRIITFSFGTPEIAKKIRLIPSKLTEVSADSFKEIKKIKLFQTFESKGDLKIIEVKSAATESDSEPAATKPAATKPAVAKPAVAKPAATKPAVAKPAVEGL